MTSVRPFDWISADCDRYARVTLFFFQRNASWFNWTWRDRRIVLPLFVLENLTVVFFFFHFFLPVSSHLSIEHWNQLTGVPFERTVPTAFFVLGPTPTTTGDGNTRGTRAISVRPQRAHILKLKNKQYSIITNKTTFFNGCKSLEKSLWKYTKLVASPSREAFVRTTNVSSFCFFLFHLFGKLFFFFFFFSLLLFFRVELKTIPGPAVPSTD